MTNHPSNNQKWKMCHKGLWSSSIWRCEHRSDAFFGLAVQDGLRRRWALNSGELTSGTVDSDFYLFLLPKNLGWSIDELSHNSKVMQAKAPSMYSFPGRIYYEQVLNIESSRIQWHSCIWSWIGLESVYWVFISTNETACDALNYRTTSTVNWLEAFSQVAEKLGHQPPSPLPHLRMKPGLWTIRTNMKELNLGCCMQQISCPFWLTFG